MIYRVAADGEEMLVNGNADPDNNNIIVVQETNPEFRIRLGKKVVAVRTDSIKAKPSTRSGTSNGMIREIKTDE